MSPVPPPPALSRCAVPAGDTPYGAAIGDVHADDVPDLAVANRYGDDVSVLLSNGDGTFAAAVLCAAGNGPIGRRARRIAWMSINRKRRRNLHFSCEVSRPAPQSL